MPKSSLAPAMRAIVFFGRMGTAVSAMTVGASLQQPADQSSTTVAMARGSGERGSGDGVRLAAVDHADRARSVAKRAIPSPSQQAMADGTPTHIVR